MVSYYATVEAYSGTHIQLSTVSAQHVRLEISLSEMRWMCALHRFTLACVERATASCCWSFDWLRWALLGHTHFIHIGRSWRNWWQKGMLREKTHLPLPHLHLLFGRFYLNYDTRGKEKLERQEKRTAQIDRHTNGWIGFSSRFFSFLSPRSIIAMDRFFGLFSVVIVVVVVDVHSSHNIFWFGQPNENE